MYRNSGLLYTRHKVAIMCEGLLTPHLEHRWPHTPHKATSYTHVVRRLGSQLWPGYWDLNCNDKFFLNGKNAKKIHARWLRFAFIVVFVIFSFFFTVHVISNIVLLEFPPILSSSSSTSWEKIDCEMTTTKNRSIRRGMSKAQTKIQSSYARFLYAKNFSWTSSISSGNFQPFSL